MDETKNTLFDRNEQSSTIKYEPLGSRSNRTAPAPNELVEEDIEVPLW